ncbi:DUF1190 domain-containing protein [Teredinibacter haidensis]|uniref:DUF1190 domain-containing protein n=1 Tax=Teredinibacter haidensis TaxID=2731755 RepID=UPI000948E1F1|nr:DUF1190 domain-containing protein [Teredinibacter haidensis]
MKRSKNISLDFMRKVSAKKIPIVRPLALAIAAITLAGCSSKEDVQVVNSVDDCISRTKLSAEQCEAAYQRALIEAERTGPKYTSQRNCESEFGSGQCRQSNGVFMPMMAGYMIGSMMSRNDYSRGSIFNPVYRYNRPFSSYNDRLMTADGKVIGRAGQSSYKVGKSNLRAKPSATRTMSRGGFGSVASAKSSWGGGKSRGWGG